MGTTGKMQTRFKMCKLFVKLIKERDAAHNIYACCIALIKKALDSVLMKCLHFPRKRSMHDESTAFLVIIQRKSNKKQKQNPNRLQNQKN